MSDQIEDRRPAIPVAPPTKRHPYDQWAPDARALDVVGDKWTLLIVRDLSAGPRRFVALQRVLPGISTEQLRSRLNRMVADELLTRKRYREVPPRVDYALTDRARALLPVIGELARWGYTQAWSAPRDKEAIDVGAILRVAPGYASPPRSLRGHVEMTVTSPSAKGAPAERSYLLSVKGGEIAVAESYDTEPQARVRGNEKAWVAALGPRRARSSLRISGKRELATGVLDALSPPAAAKS